MIRSANKPPSLNKNDIPDIKKVAHFINWFLKNDPVVNMFLNSNLHSIFAEGLRPKNFHHNPNSSYNEQKSLEQWLIYTIYLDLNLLINTSKYNFERFLDDLDKKSAKAQLISGKISLKYNLLPQDYKCEEKINKISNPKEKKCFKKNLLTEHILEAEIRILSWLYYDYYGERFQVKT